MIRTRKVDLKKVKAGQTLWVVFTQHKLDIYGKLVDSLASMTNIPSFLSVIPVHVLGPMFQLGQHWYIPIAPWNRTLLQINSRPHVKRDDETDRYLMAVRSYSPEAPFYATYRQALNAAVNMVEDSHHQATHQKYCPEVKTLVKPKLDAADHSRFTLKKAIFHEMEQMWESWKRLYEAKNFKYLPTIPLKSDSPAPTYRDVGDLDVRSSAVVIAGKGMGKTLAMAKHLREAEEQGVIVLRHKPRDYLNRVADKPFVMDYDEFFDTSTLTSLVEAEQNKPKEGEDEG